MVSASNHVDEFIVHDFAKGMPVVGELPPSGLWKPGGQPMLQKLDSYLQSLDTTRQKVYGGLRPGEHDDVLWSASVSGSTLLGPFFEHDDVSKVVGCTDWCAARRFPVTQFKDWTKTTKKIRPCDDKRRDQVNSITSTVETVRMATSDDVAALGRAWLVSSPGCQLSLFSADLKSAYRQVPVAPSDLRFNIITFLEPGTGRQAFFVGTALLFGCRSSVPNFCRVPESLVHILRPIFLVPADHMVDDMWALERETSLGSSVHIFREVMSLLGFRIEDAKTQLGRITTALGVEIDLSNASVHMSIAPPRKVDLIAELTHILDEGRLLPAHAGKLRGKLQFVSANLSLRQTSASLPARTGAAPV